MGSRFNICKECIAGKGWSLANNIVSESDTVRIVIPDQCDMRTNPRFHSKRKE